MNQSNEPAAAWAKGWTVSRGTPAPVEVPEGLRIEVGLPGHRVRYVIPRYDGPALRALADRLDEPGTWLKVCAAPADVSGVLDERWQVQPPEYLMSSRLSSADDHPDAPAAYEVVVVVNGDVIDAFVTAGDGQRAARGRAALADGVAVFDQVETDPDHRRRGLGRLVMSSLAGAAVRGGAGTGLLLATEDGRGLYSSLGWSLRSIVTAAVLT